MAKVSDIIYANATTKFIVGPSTISKGAPYMLIQSAIDVAYQAFLDTSTSQTVLVKPGKYEEDITFRPGVVIIGAHDPSFMNTQKLSDPADIDYNFGVFIVGTHVIPANTFSGDYNIKNIYFLSKGFGNTGTFSDHIIEYNEDGEDGTASKILIENCKFLIAYHPTNISGSIFYCSPVSAAKYANASVIFNECSFYCPSPASSGEYTDTYNAFHLVGKQNTVYKFNNCIFDGTNDNESQGSLYSCLRLRDLGTSHWLTSFEKCKFSYFTIAAAEEGATSNGYVDISLIECQIPIVYSHFFYFADKVGKVKVHNCLIDLDDGGVFINENSNAVPIDFSTMGTIFRRKDANQAGIGIVDGVNTVTAAWLKDSAKVIDGHPTLYAVYSDSTTQTAASANRAYPVQFNTHESTVGNNMMPSAAGVYIDEDNQATPKPTCITFSAAGVYNIQFSIQLERTSGSGTDTVNFFLRKNGETYADNVPRSNTYFSLDGNNAKVVAAWNFVVTASEGDFYQLMWATSSTNISLVAVAAVNGTAPNYYNRLPAAPSVILTVTKVR